MSPDNAPAPVSASTSDTPIATAAVDDPKVVSTSTSTKFGVSTSVVVPSTVSAVVDPSKVGDTTPVVVSVDVPSASVVKSNISVNPSQDGDTDNNVSSDISTITPKVVDSSTEVVDLTDDCDINKSTNGEPVSGSVDTVEPSVNSLISDNAQPANDGVSTSGKRTKYNINDIDLSFRKNSKPEDKAPKSRVALSVSGNNIDPPSTPPSTSSSDGSSSGHDDDSDSMSFSNHSDARPRSFTKKRKNVEDEEPESDIERFGLTRGTSMMIVTPPKIRFKAIKHGLHSILLVEACSSHNMVHTWFHNWTAAIESVYRLVPTLQTRLFDMATRNAIYKAIVRSMKIESLQLRLTRELRTHLLHTERLSLSKVLEYLERFCIAEGGETTVILERFCNKLVSSHLPRATEVPVRANLLAELKQKLPMSDWQFNETLRVYCGTRDQIEDWRLFLEMYAPFTTDKPMLGEENIGRYYGILARRHNPLRPSTTKGDKNNKRDRVDSSRPKSHKKGRTSQFEDVVCHRCNQKGHKKFELYKCPKSDKYVDPGTTKTTSSTAMSVTVATDGVSPIILDSGANVHVFNNKRWFTEFVSENQTMETAGGSSMSSGHGTVKLPLRDSDGGVVWVTLNNCYFRPGNFVLVSKKRLLWDGCFSSLLWEDDCGGINSKLMAIKADGSQSTFNMVTTEDKCDALPVVAEEVAKILKSSNSAVTKGIRNFPAGPCAHVALTTPQPLPPKMIRVRTEVMHWHLAANHAGTDAVVELAKRCGYRFTREALTQLRPEYLACNTCRAIKISDAPVSRRMVNPSITANQVWFVDHLKFENLGLMDTTYALVVVDDFSKYNWVFIGPRDKACFFLEHLVLNNFNNGRPVPGTICSDEAYEFGGLSSDKFSKLGCNHHIVPARHHESLGVAENCIRTLKNSTKCLLHHSGLPFMFWPYALHYASWHKNWMVSQAHNIRGRVPAEVWATQESHWPSHWIPFGCDVSFVTGKQLKKNEDTARIAHGCFFGFDWGRFDSSALVFVPSFHRVITVPVEKLRTYPLQFTMAAQVDYVFESLVPEGSTSQNHCIPLRRLCYELIQTGNVFPAAIPADFVSLCEGEQDPHRDAFRFGGSIPVIVPEGHNITSLPSGSEESYFFTPLGSSASEVSDVATSPGSPAAQAPSGPSIPVSGTSSEVLDTSTVHSMTTDSDLADPAVQFRKPTRRQRRGAHQIQARRLAHVRQRLEITPLPNNIGDTEGSSASSSEAASDEEWQLGSNAHKVTGRGRPPKTSSATTAPASATTKRGRGRPRKTAISSAPELSAFSVTLHPTVLAIGEVRLPDPKTYKQAMQRPDAARWQEAIDTELDNMRRNEVWSPISFDASLSRGMLRLFWVFKTKVDSSGVVTKYKARLVVLGNHQSPDQYDSVYAGVVQKSAVLLFFVTAQRLGFEILKLDIAAAFLNGSLDRTLYCHPAEGDASIPAHSMLRLNKALYGLKQAPRLWYSTISTLLCSLGFEPLVEEPCLFVSHKGDGSFAGVLALYVDDILLAGKPDFLDQTAMDKFEVSECGSVTEYLGVKLNVAASHVALSLPGTVMSMVEELSALPQVAQLVAALKKQSVPMSSAFKSQLSEVFLKGKPTNSIGDIRAMQKIAGCLNYLVSCGRIDLAAVAVHLSVTAHNPYPVYWEVAARTIRYLEATFEKSLAISMSPTTQGIELYTDASFHQLPDGRAILGYLIYLNGSLVCWGAKACKMHPDSTFEAELLALNLGLQYARKIKILGSRLKLVKAGTVVDALCDNAALVGAVKNSEYAGNVQTAHLLRTMRKLQNWRDNRMFEIKHICSKDMKADFLTKAMDKSLFEEQCKGVGLYSNPAEITPAW